MKKILSSLCMMLLLFALASCDKDKNNNNNENNNNENNNNNQNQNTNVKYETDGGEIVINDSNLINSSNIDDNYRVFYEIFTGSFSDSNKDGIGDLQGIINKLDYLNDGNPNSGKSLGIQGIWLTPIFSSPTYHKYDVTDYYTIDPQFGTIEDLKNLISECHKRNIKLILDLPINHTGDQNDWFTRFVKAHQENDTANPFYNFYSFYNSNDEKPYGNFNIIANTNDHYECNFTSNMPELNYDNEIVRQEVLNIAKYYLALGIDGFRFDAAKYIYYGNEVKSAEFWNWYVSELKKVKPDVYTVGEVWSADGITDIYYKQGLNCFNFTVSQGEGRIATAAKETGNVTVYTNYIQNYVKTIKSYNSDLMIMPFIANHDTDRAAGYLQPAKGYAQMAANLYILSSGSPFIYYGEEIGMKGTRAGASSDANRRLAMLWGDDDTIKNPTEATYKDKNQINGTVATQIGNENSLLTHYKKVIMIRNANPEIARGEYKALESSISTIGGFTATYNNSTVCVIHNTGLESATIDLSSLTNLSFTTISGYTGMKDVKLENNKITIEAQSSIVLK